MAQLLISPDCFSAVALLILGDGANAPGALDESSNAPRDCQRRSLESAILSRERRVGVPTRGFNPTLKTGGLSMRRIALCLYAAVLVLPLVGCKKEATPPTDTNSAAPGGDSDKDGQANAADDKPADPAAK